MHQRPDDRDRRLVRVDVAAIVERILGERLADGGWNCEAETLRARSGCSTGGTEGRGRRRDASAAAGERLAHRRA